MSDGDFFLGLGEQNRLSSPTTDSWIEGRPPDTCKTNIHTDKRGRCRFLVKNYGCVNSRANDDRRRGFVSLVVEVIDFV